MPMGLFTNLAENTNTPPADESKPKRQPDAILDNHLHVKHDLTPADLRNAVFFNDPANRAHLASQILLYEHIIVPTRDFGLIPGFIQWMGLKEFEAALDDGTFRFVRRRALAYVGNGGGLQEYAISDTPARPFNWWEKALYGDLDLAIDIQLRHCVSSLPVQHREALIKKVISCSQPVSYDHDFFKKNIAKETYIDIRDTPELCNSMLRLAISAGHIYGEPLDIARVPGIERSAVQVAGEGAVKNPADFVARIGEANLEIVLADLVGGADLYASAGVDRFLKRKVLRAGFSSQRLEAFGRILDLNKIPDLRVAVRSGALSLPEIWKVRQSSEGRRFRRWLRQAEAKDGRDLERLYVESLKHTSIVESLPLRIFRFALTNTIGLIATSNPAIGVVAGMLDSFFVERFLKGYQPKLFLDELRKLLP